MKSNEYKLLVDTDGEETELFFKSELEMKNWLLDSGFKTLHKRAGGEMYYRFSTQSTALWQYK